MLAEEVRRDYVRLAKAKGLDTGCTYWQVLPFTPTDAYNSPYASISAFAGNRNFIDLEQLRDEGLLTDDELQTAPAMKCRSRSSKRARRPRRTPANPHKIQRKVKQHETR